MPLTAHQPDQLHFSSAQSTSAAALLCSHTTKVSTPPSKGNCTFLLQPHLRLSMWVDANSKCKFMAGFPLLWSSSVISEDNPWCQLSTGPSSTSQTSSAEHNLKPIWLLEHPNLGGILKLLELRGEETLKSSWSSSSKAQTPNHSLCLQKSDQSNIHHSNHPLDTGYQPLQILLFKSSWNAKQTCSSKALIHGALQSREKQLRSNGIFSWIHRREIKSTYFSKVMSYPEEAAGLVQLLLSKEEPI